MTTSKPIITITVDKELFEKIEEYQFANKIPNRSQAFDRLVLEGFKSLENKKVRHETKEKLIELINKL